MRQNSLISFIIMAMALLLPSIAQACYSPREVEAAQGIRIHSELMVIGLACAKTPNGAALYSKYKAFTDKNSSIISAYEGDMIAYYKMQGAAQAEQRFHSLRSSLANDISRHAARMGAAGFCQQFSGRLDQALMMDEQTFRRWAQQVWPGQSFPDPVCQ